MTQFLEKAIEMLVVKFAQTRPVTQWQLKSLGSLILRPGSNAAGSQGLYNKTHKNTFYVRQLVRKKYNLSNYITIFHIKASASLLIHTTFGSHKFTPQGELM